MSALADTGPKAHRFTRERYERMIDAGIFGEDDRVELLDGEIVQMAPQKSLHAAAVTLVARALESAFGEGRFARVQLPVALGPHSEPEPDVAIVAGAPRDYRDAHPRHPLLIVEIAETTLAYDRGPKLAAYARSGIAEYWILDVKAGALHVCRGPQDDGSYAERRTLRAGERIAPLAAPAGEIAVADLLP